MNHLIFTRVDGRLFWSKRQTPMSKYVISQCRNYFTVVKTIQKSRKDLPKPFLGPKKLQNVQFFKNFSSDFQNQNILMNFDVWSRPSFLKSIKNIYYFFFKIQKIDESFSIQEFLSSGNTALRVVTDLLSELRFSELEGLLTPECREEVEKNIKLWPRTQVSALAFKPDQISTVAPGDAVIFSDGKNKERLFIEIRLIHYIYLKSPAKMENSNFKIILGFTDITDTEKFNNVYMYGLFNSRFIREYTKGVDDQWTINALNVKYLS